MKYIVVIVVLFGVVFASELERQHDARTVPQSYCRWCKSCSNEYSYEAGRKLNQSDYGSWTTFGDFCQAPYVTTWNEVSLCCKTAYFGDTCKLCQSCGNGFPINEGNAQPEGDWGPYLQYGTSCSGGLLPVLEPPSLCCQTEKKCRICDSYCGGDYPNEIGAVTHEGDYGSWNMYGGGCSGTRSSSWGYPKFCCGTSPY